MNTSDLKSFNYLENGEISFSMFDTIKTNKCLDAGFYDITYLESYPEGRVVLNVNKNTETVKIHNFPEREKIDNLFDSFFNETVVEKISLLGFYHKTGILLFGKEGTGKSTIIKYYSSLAISKKHAIVFHMNCYSPSMSKCWDFIVKIRKIQNNPIVVIFEEFDEHIKNRNDAVLKTILDGNLSIDNCMFMATTNHISEIPEAIKNRPSRFKYVLNIEGLHDKNDIYIIVEKMIGDLFSKEDIDTFVNELIGQPLDFIKQFCIDKIMKLNSYTHNKKKQVGFKKFN